MSLYCRYIGRRLPLFVGGDLGFRATRRVRGHLQRCGECYGLYQSFRRAHVALHRMGDAHEPAAVSEEFWPELRRRLRGGDRPARRQGRSRVVARVALAAGLLFTFGAGFLIGDPSILDGRPAEAEDRAKPLSPVAGDSPFSQFQRDFAEPVNHTIPSRVGSYYFPKSRFVLPQDGRQPESHYFPRPVRTSGGEDDFR